MVQARGVRTRLDAGSRFRRLLGLVPVAVLGAACGGGGGGGGGEVGTGAPLQVMQSTPTNNQETTTTLSDPGLGGQVRVQFSDSPRQSSMIDQTNAFNGLTPNVQILDQFFARVEGTPSVDPTQRLFTFTPKGGSLLPNQYTLTISRFVSTPSGERMNHGLKDFSTSFCVGADSYPPVVRNTTPAANQNEVNLFQPIVITFNESIDPATVVLGQTVFVQDGGTNPPTQLVGTLGMDRDNFDIVFTPDPCTGMPPATTVVVRMLGTGAGLNPSFLRDMVGNGLVGGAAPSEVTFQFNTKGGNPLPDPCAVPPPGSPLRNIFRFGFYASTQGRVVAFDTRPFINASGGGVFRPELTQQVTSTGVGPFNYCTNLPASMPYRGNWEAKMASTGQAVVDWRTDPTTNHTYIYMCDETNNRVAIINTGTGKVEGHFNGVGSPRGIALTGVGLGVAVLCVTNYGEGTVTGIDLSPIVPGQPICTAVAALNEDPARRGRAQVGRAPTGAACEWYGNQLLMVTNSGDNSLSVLDPVALRDIQFLPLQPTYQVGESPSDVVITQVVTGPNVWAWVVNKGGAQDPNGSVSLWWNNAGGYIFTQGTGSVVAEQQEGVDNPGRPFQDPLSLNLILPNAATDTMSTIAVSTAGSVIFTTITSNLLEERAVPGNPVAVTWEPFTIRFHIVACAGTGQVAMFDTQNAFSPPVFFPVPGIRDVFSVYDQ
jgi:hypothetical protein